MNNITVDFNANPAKAKCSKCGKIEEIPPNIKLSETVKKIKEIEDKHKDCVQVV